MNTHYRQIKVQKKITPLTNRGTVKIDIPKVQNIVRVPPKIIVPVKQVAINNVPAVVREVKEPAYNHNLMRKVSHQHVMAPVKRKGVVQDENYQGVMSLKGIGTSRILVMVACGPSTLEVDFSSLASMRNVDVMVINKPFKPVWPPRFWAFCDQSQYLRNQEDFNVFNGTLITSSAVVARKRGQIIIKAKQILGGNFFSKDLTDGYIIGQSSVYANMQTAAWMNYDKVFIFGVDMAPVNGALHHYGTNPDVKPEIRVERFKKEAKNYERMANSLGIELRKKFFFCSSYNPWPFPDLFNRVDHKNAIALLQ